MMRSNAFLASVSFSFILCADTLRVPVGLDSYVPAPEENPLSRDKVQFGRALFSFRGLSRDGTLSCADCHKPDRAFTDDRPRAVGVRGQVGARRTPRLLNRAWGRAFFWDGRTETLEKQVLQPVLNPLEMDLPVDEIARRVNESAELQKQAKRLYGREAVASDVAQALAAYVRTILAGDSPYDRYTAGDRSALTEKQRLGLELFRGKANCVSCHLGPNLTDEEFHNTGIGFGEDRWNDLGRMAHSGAESDRGAFKTPGLRQIAGSGPYMHDGSLQTLEDVVEYYDKGGRPNANLDGEIRPLKLTSQEKQALVAFLHALSGKVSEGWPESR